MGTRHGICIGSRNLPCNAVKDKWPSLTTSPNYDSANRSFKDGSAILLCRL